MPFAPGTFGALVAMLIAYGLYYLNLDWTSYHIILSCLIILSYFLGVMASRAVQSEWGHDASKIVIDEACGYWISLLLIPISPLSLVLGFILFRFFDIVKPLGIRKIDAWHESAHAVMLDDVVAGLYSAVVLHLIFYFFIQHT